MLIIIVVLFSRHTGLAAAVITQGDIYNWL